MTDWWEYEPSTDYYSRLRQKFEEQARKDAASAMMRKALASRGLMPDIAPSLADTQQSGFQPPAPEKPAEKKPSGGLLGRIKDTLGDVTETVFQGAVDEPWDVLRPLQNALEAEMEYVAKPTIRGAFSLGYGGAQTLRGRQSLGEAFRTGWEEYENLPGGVTTPLEIVASPSTWIPAGLVVKGLKGARLGLRLAILEPVFGRRALAAMAGGAEEPKLLRQMIERFGEVGKSDVIGLRSVDEVAQELRQSEGMFQVLRRAAGKDRRIGGLMQRLGIRAFDDDTAILASEAARIKAIGESARNSWETVMRQVAKAAGLRMDDQGRLLDVYGQPFIEDVAQNLAAYPGITTRQADAIKLMAEPLQTLRQLEKAAGIKAARPVDVYFHRQAIAKPVETAVGRGEAALGPEVGRYYGAKQPFQRPITYPTKAEGIAAGVEYEPFFQAQGARIEQGFNRIADNWLDAALSEIGRTPTQLVPEALRTSYQASATRTAWLRAISKEVNRFARTPARPVRGKSAFKIPTKPEARAFFRQAGDMPDDLKPIVDDLMNSSKLPRQADRHLAFLDAQEKVKTLLDTAKAERKLSHAQVSRFKKGLTAQEAGGTAEFPRFFRGRYYPEEIGARLQEEFAVRGYGAFQPVIAFNNLLRAVVASFDASGLGIQGLLAAATSPKVWVQALKNAMFFGYDDLMREAHTTGVLGKFLRAGGHISSDQVGEFIVGKALTRAPVVGKGFRISNAWFSRTGNVIRLKLFENSLKPGMSETALKQLARNVNLATGYSHAKPHSAETVVLFAPRFFRSQLGLLADAMTRTDLAGRRAKLQLASLMALGTALVATVNKAQGRETEWNPTKPNFLRIRAFGRDISPFGPWDSLMRALSVYATQGPVEGSKYLARTKASPAMGRVYDIITTETFRGDPIDWSNPVTATESLARLGSQVLPISVQQSLIEQGLPTNPAALSGSLVEFMGTKATPTTAWERLADVRDNLAQQEYQKNWDELGPSEHWNLQQKYPKELERPEAATDIGKYLEARRAIGDRYFSFLQELENAVQSGQLSLPEWREQYTTLRKLQSGEYQGLDSASPEIVAELSKDPSNPNEKALHDYLGAFRSSVTPWGTTDPERLDEAISRLEQSWTPAQKQYVETNTGYKNTPTLARYRAAQKVLRPYWEIRTEAWQELVQKRPDLKQFATDEDYFWTLQQQMISLGMSPEQAAQKASQSPTIRAFESIVAARRRAWRGKNPKGDQLLAEFYGYTPLYLQATATRPGQRLPRLTPSRS